MSFRTLSSLALFAIVSSILLSSSSNNSSSNSNRFLVAANIVIAPRHCHGSVRHLHLAVGNDPSRSMTVSFASTWAFPDRVAPVAGVFVGTVPPPHYDSSSGDSSTSTSTTSSNTDYTEFLASSTFYPEQEEPITYTIYMQHKKPDQGLYYAPYQHHISVEGLEPDTTYYYLPVLGDREKGIDTLEEHSRGHFARASVKSKLNEQQQGGNPMALDIQTEAKLTKEQQVLIEEEVEANGNGSGNGNDRHHYHHHRSRRYLSRGSSQQHYEYDEAYLGRDYDANTEIVEIDPSAPLWDANGRRLSPPPYDPTGIACIDAGKIRSFRTAPEEANGNGNGYGNDGESESESGANGGSASALYPMTFGIIGDIGQFEHSQEVLNHIRDHAKGIRAVVLVGDIAYPDYDGRKWDTFFDFLDDQSNFDEIPLMVAAGNHDIDKQYAGNQIFLGYEHRFRMPRVKPPELGVFDGDCEDGAMNMDAPPYPLPYEWGNSYYAFTYGPARHVIVNAYADMSPGSTQYEWLENELASIDREKTPWVLLTMHPPIYNTFSLHHHDPQIFAAKEHLEPLFVNYHVNLVLTGHIHAYQRTDYIAFGNLTETGPMHITIGAGGRKADAPFTNKEPEEWLKVRDASMYGYGRLTIENATHAEWRWIPIAPSELHDYNQVKGEDDLHLPPLDHDKKLIENQYYRRLRRLEESSEPNESQRTTGLR